MAHSSRTLMGIKTTIASTIVALFAAFAAPLTPASAHAHAAISVTDVKLTRSDANGNPIASPLRNDDIASFSFTWSAGDAAVSEGESITVGLPEFFGNLDYGRAAALTAQRMGSTVPIGTCAIAKRSLACTFAKGLNALRAQGFVDMKGTISVLLKATSQTAAKSARFLINGKPVSVSIPGGGIGPRPAAAYQPVSFGKVAGALGAESKILLWSINFGSNHVSEKLKASGRDLPLNGKSTAISFTDQLGPGQAFQSNGRGRWVLFRTSGRGDKAARREPLTDSSGYDYSTSHGNFDMSVETRGAQAVIKASGPWAPDTNYAIGYATDLANGKATPGFAYSSTVKLDGTPLASTFSRYYTDPFSSKVDLNAAFGSFDIHMSVSGTHTPDFSSNATFPVTADYTLPEGMKVTSYKGWKAPGTVNGSGTGGSVTLMAKTGQTTAVAERFPAGTRVTLREDLSHVSGAAQGVSWQKPVFKLEDREIATLTIGAKARAKVTVVNTVAKRSAPESSPSTVVPTASPSSPASPTPTSGPTTSRTPEPSPSTPPTPSASPTAPTMTPTPTPTSSPTPTPTSSPTTSQAPKPSASPTAPPTPTPSTPAPTMTPTPKPSPSPTADPSPSPTGEPTATGKPTPSTEPSPTGEPTATGKPTSTGKPTPSTEPSPTPKPSTTTRQREPEPSNSSLPEPSPSDPATPTASSSAPSKAESELELMSILGLDTESEFLKRVDGPGQIVSTTSKYRTPVARNNAISPLPSVRQRSSGIPIIDTGMDMGGGVICAFGMGLIGAALVLRRYLA